MLCCIIFIGQICFYFSIQNQGLSFWNDVSDFLKRSDPNHQHTGTVYLYILFNNLFSKNGSHKTWAIFCLKYMFIKYINKREMFLKKRLCNANMFEFYYFDSVIPVNLQGSGSGDTVLKCWNILSIWSISHTPRWDDGGRF